MADRLIVNCFSYSDEKELLKFRIDLLKDYIDLFIITEGDQTFSGEAKAYSCKKTLDELGIAQDKIKVVEVSLSSLEQNQTPKSREKILRDAAKDHIPENSVCYVTDPDEILDPAFINYYVMVKERNPGAVIRVLMANLSSRVDRCLQDSEGKEIQHNGAYLCSSETAKQRSLSDLRNIKFGAVYHLYLRDDGEIKNAGWKFEWMGGKERRKEIYKSSVDYALHSELGRQLRLEFLDSYQPIVGSVDAMSKKSVTLKEYDTAKLPRLIFDESGFHEFFLPAEISDKESQQPLSFGPESLPYLKFNKTPTNSVYIVDNFYEDPYAVREFAMNQEYADNPKNQDYVGRRTLKQYFPPGLKERFEEIIGEKIVKWEGYGYNGRFQYNVAGQPLVYHCDNQKWAGLIYLTPDPPYQAGTRLLAHKKTRIRSSEEPGIMECFTQETFLDGTPFETVDQIGNVFNRLVIYRGRMIHAASEYFGHNMETGRLWHMFFFD